MLVIREAVEGWRRRQRGLVGRQLDPRDWVLLLLGLSLFAFLLSLGPVVHVAARPIGPGLYAWLHPYVLPLRALRAANRIGVLVVFAVSLLAAFGVTWLRARLPRRAFVPVVSALGLLLALEYATFPLAYGRVPSLARPVDRILKDAPADAVVLEWPTYVPMTDADAMLRSIGHGKRIVNGYSGFVPRLPARLSKLLTMPGPPFPVPAAEAYLRRIYPLDFLVVRLTDPALTPEWRAKWRELRQAPPPFLRFRGSYGDEDLWELTPMPERGMVAERWVSFGFLREHPILRATLRPLAEDPTLEQSAQVLLNGQPVAEQRIDGGEVLTATLPPPNLQAAFNVVTLDFQYRRPRSALDERYRIGATGSVSPGDLRVASAGQPYGESAKIAFNGVELAANWRGYNLVALAPDGRVQATGVFDTFLDPKAASRLAAFVAGLPDGTMVAGAVRDEASLRLTEEAVAALRTLGVAGDLRGHFRESHAFIGVKGAAPGSALEELGQRALTLTVGRPPPILGFELQSFALERRPALRRPAGSGPPLSVGGRLPRDHAVVVAPEVAAHELQHGDAVGNRSEVRPLPRVARGDREVDHPKAQDPGGHEHLLVEDEPPRREAPERDGLQRGAPVEHVAAVVLRKLEAEHAVLHPGQPAVGDVLVERHAATKGPAAPEARALDDVGPIRVQRGEERRERLGRVLAVAVEPGHHVRAELEGPREARLRRAPVAAVLSVLHQIERREARPEPVRHRRRPVCAAVVDDDVAGGAGDDLGRDAAEDALERLRGVVGGNRDGEPARASRRPADHQGAGAEA